MTALIPKTNMIEPSYSSSEYLKETTCLRTRRFQNERKFSTKMAAPVLEGCRLETIKNDQSDLHTLVKIDEKSI